ncbi:MAG: conserved hypothetical protein partial [Methanobrevibacter sp. CfCl-M3]
MNKYNKDTDLDFSTKEKSFDAVKFKRKLQENVWKHSKANNSIEFMEYINKNAKKSYIYKNKKNL